jgi:hypothetical protein
MPKYWRMQKIALVPCGDFSLYCVVETAGYFPSGFSFSEAGILQYNKRELAQTQLPKGENATLIVSPPPPALHQPPSRH